MRTALLGFALATSLGCARDAVAQTYGPDGDIWKYQMPKEGVRGEFANEDVTGVIAGKHIRTDCSVKVIKGGKTDCLTAAASQTFLEYAPNINLAKAREAWDRMKSDGMSDASSQ